MILIIIVALRSAVCVTSFLSMCSGRRRRRLRLYYCYSRCRHAIQYYSLLQWLRVCVCVCSVSVSVCVSVNRGRTYFVNCEFDYYFISSSTLLLRKTAIQRKERKKK